MGDKKRKANRRERRRLLREKEAADVAQMEHAKTEHAAAKVSVPKNYDLSSAATDAVFARGDGVELTVDLKADPTANNKSRIRARGGDAIAPVERLEDRKLDDLAWLPFAAAIPLAGSTPVAAEIGTMDPGKKESPLPGERKDEDWLTRGPASSQAASSNIELNSTHVDSAFLGGNPLLEEAPPSQSKHRDPLDFGPERKKDPPPHRDDFIPRKDLPTPHELPGKPPGIEEKKIPLLGPDTPPGPPTPPTPPPFVPPPPDDKPPVPVPDGTVLPPDVVVVPFEPVDPNGGGPGDDPVTPGGGGNPLPPPGDLPPVVTPPGSLPPGGPPVPVFSAGDDPVAPGNGNPPPSATDLPPVVALPGDGPPVPVFASAASSSPAAEFAPELETQVQIVNQVPPAGSFVEMLNAQKTNVSPNGVGPALK